MQETWLRWDGLGPDGRAEVLDPRAYLVRIVSRLALNRLRTLARRKEDYVGEWLPEPLLTAPDVADDVELAESVSMAMLTVLETLTPTERAVFVLREVFDLPFDEIAAATGPVGGLGAPDRAPGAVARRGPAPARRGRPGPATPGGRPLPAGPAHRRPAGADGHAGPGRRAHRRRRRDRRRGRVPVIGAKKIVNLLGGLARFAPTAVIEPMLLNGAPGARVVLDGAVDTVIGFAFEDGRISRVFAVRNPDKLRRLGEETALSR